MKFMAYSPLAGGFLTGKPTFSAPSDLVGTRFEHTDSNSTHGPFYRMWYNKESMHEAVKTLKASADLFDISKTEIAIRWLTHHSALRDGDGIIVGPETVDELDDCVRAYRAGPLPEDLVKVIEELQNTVSTDAESIVRL
jgi:aflatoxin B1 aldehyde reductase